MFATHDVSDTVTHTHTHTHKKKPTPSPMDKIGSFKTKPRLKQINKRFCINGGS